MLTIKSKAPIKKEIDYNVLSENYNKVDFDNFDFNTNIDNLKDDGFLKKMQEIVKSQRLYMDSRQETIKKKIEEYQILKRDYYEQNKEKRLEYDREYRERKKEQLKAYRQKYYEKQKEKKLEEEKNGNN
jgi:hypothetical protein